MYVIRNKAAMIFTYTFEPLILLALGCDPANVPAVVFKESVLAQLSTAHVTTETLGMPLNVKSFNNSSYHPATW